MPYCYKCGTQTEPNDSFCTKCGAQLRMTTTNIPNNPYAAPKYCKTCPKCQSYVNAVLQRCPYCDFVFITPHGSGSGIGGLSTKKFLSLLALALAILGLFWGIFFEVAALVIGIVSLCIKERKEKGSKIFAVLAIILSIVTLAFGILLSVFIAYAKDHLMDGLMKYIFDLIYKIIKQ